MNLFTGFEETRKTNKSAFFALGFLIVIATLVAFISLLYPSAFFVIVNFLWISLILLVGIFLVLGVLVILGMRKEVSRILDIMLEGSLTIIDALDFIKNVYYRFIEVLKDFIYFITPVISVIVSIALYILLLILYKTVGADNDVTILTAILSGGLVAAVAIINRGKEAQELITWWALVRERFRQYFADSFEVIIFVFFLTMDSTNLFFLPENLNVPLHAMLGKLDLMVTGFDVSVQAKATISFVTIAISIEVIRVIIKMIALAIAYYNRDKELYVGSNGIKIAIRNSFGDTKDDIVKFITFTTALIAVFLFFPRLKLFAMVVASLTALILDFAIPSRLIMKQGNDLISRILNKVFRL